MNFLDDISCMFCKFKSDSFQHLSVLELELVNAHKVYLKFKKGEHIAKQGFFATHILFVQKGMVKVYIETGQDQNIILNFLKSGDMVALPTLFTNHPLPYSVSAVEDTSICAMDRTVIENLIQQNGKFARSIIQAINHCNHLFYHRLISASHKQLNGRLADALLHLSDHIYQSDSFPMNLTRKELAEFAMMSTMSVIRTIKEFINQNIIREDKNYLHIVEKKKLIDISKKG